MIPEDLFKQIAFIKEIDKLKYIERQTRLLNSNRRENDAEHSWHLAMMAIVLQQHANEEVDVLKVVKMVLIHDIVEIDAGDTFIYDNLKSHDNSGEERLAAKRIFGILPEDQAEDFTAIWEEFELGESMEAKFTRTMDRLEPLLQNYSNNGGTWNIPGVTYEKVYAKKSVMKNGSSSIWEYAAGLIQDAVEKGILKKS